MLHTVGCTIVDTAQLWTVATALLSFDEIAYVVFATRT